MAKQFTDELEGKKRTAWFLTALVALAAFPLLKNAILAVLVKLYEWFLQHTLTM